MQKKKIGGLGHQINGVVRKTCIVQIGICTGGVLECVYAKNGRLVQPVNEILRSLGQSSIIQCSYEEKNMQNINVCCS